MMGRFFSFFKKDLTKRIFLLFFTKSIEILGRIVDVERDRENRVFKTDRTKKNLLILGLDRRGRK